MMRLTIRVDFPAGGAFGPGKARLLELIDELKSIRRAAAAMDMSYRQAWLLVQGAEEIFGGPIVETAIGGAHGGGSKLTALGRELFFDRSLSSSGRQSCATCHDPAHAFGPADAGPVADGGPDLRRPGVRAVPSLGYLQAVPPFTAHFFEPEDEADESVDNGPTGGLTWDGRVDRGRDQARIPLLSPFEMANRNPAEVAAAPGKAEKKPARSLDWKLASSALAEALSSAEPTPGGGVRLPGAWLRPASARRWPGRRPRLPSPPPAPARSRAGARERTRPHVRRGA